MLGSMNQRLSCLLAAGLLALLPGAPVSAQEREANSRPIHPPSAIEEREKTRLRSVRLRIRPTGTAEFGACLDLDVAELKVSLRGERIDDLTRLTLDRTERPNVHALLIDTSGSMTGKLEYVKAAARQYVEQLDPQRETALIATFDESVILRQAVTADREELIRGIEGVRLSDSTSMLDGLVYTIRELQTRRERPVLLLLTDGVDVGSLNERHDVVAIAAGRPDLMIFTIGLQLPPILSCAPAGFNSTRSFLQRLAQRTRGKYFEAPTPSRLEPVYRRIREMLDNEAILDVLDPDPQAEPGKLRVSSRRNGCAIDLLGELYAEEPEVAVVAPPYPELPARLGLSFSEMWNFHINRAHHSVDPACGPVEEGSEADMEYLADTVWHVDIDQQQVSGCALDLTMETGLLYDPMSDSWDRWNRWIKLATRPFVLPVSAPGSLPQRPEQLMDSLALQALSAESREVETDPRQRPEEWHARPYSDLPMIFHGRTFLEMRPRLAHALFLTDEYRTWTMDRLQAEARADLQALERRLQRRAPQYSAEAVHAAVLLSPEAMRIEERARIPREADLQRYLAAWLGDIPAHDLFVRWEIERINRALLQEGPTFGDAFIEEWRALRRLFFVPSYARVLALLTPVYDPERDVIGFYRAVLPRPGWFLPRLGRYAKHPDWVGLPLDLLPEQPLGYWTLEMIRVARPALGRMLREQNYRVVELSYESLQKARKQNPRRVFRHTRVKIELAPATGAPGATQGFTLRVQADLTLKPDDAGPELDAVRVTSVVE